MKNDNNISILNYEEIEIVDCSKFIERIKIDNRLKEYANLELMRKNEIRKNIKNEIIEKYNESIFNYIRSVKVIDENGKTKDANIVYGQVFTINYEKKIIKIIDKKIYNGHFERTNEYKYFFKDVGIIEDEIKVILNNISKMKRKNNCNFLLYVLANRDKKLNENGDNSKIEKEINNLFKLWNITEKYYSYKQYKIYLKLYEELYMDYLKNNLHINLLQYENIKKQMKEIKKEMMKGV